MELNAICESEKNRRKVGAKLLCCKGKNELLLQKTNCVSKVGKVAYLESRLHVIGENDVGA